MSKILQFRRDSTSNLASVTGAVGELFVDLDKDTIVVMDGATAGGFPLATEALLSSANTSTTTAFSANDYTTYTTLQGEYAANDGVTLDSARANDHATLLSAFANDGVTLATARANDHATLLSAFANDGVTLATARANDHSTLDSARANDHSTYITLQSEYRANDGVTLATARANDHATLLTAYANDFALYSSIQGFGIVSVSGQSNVSATSISETLTLEQGTGIVITTNAESKTINFASSGGSGDEYARTLAILGY